MNFAFSQGKISEGHKVSALGTPLEDALSELGILFSLPLQTGPSQPGTKEALGGSYLLCFHTDGGSFFKRFLEFLVFGKT